MGFLHQFYCVNVQRTYAKTRSWQTTSTKCVSCFRLFRAYPDIQSAFPHIKVLDPTEAKYREDVMTHGTRVLDTIELMLSKIDDLDSLVAEVHALGRKHVAFNAKVDYIDVSIKNKTVALTASWISNHMPTYARNELLIYFQTVKCCTVNVWN